MADAVTKSLTGYGIWGVEFFVGKDGVYFSELSPRPHDTGMVTLANTQNFNEFELHLRAVLGLPIPEITLERAAANAVLLASANGKQPIYHGLVEAASIRNSDLRIFGKPTTRPYRRMGIALSYGPVGSDTTTLRQQAKEIADRITIEHT
jgi:phosphoribosylglycinamide formyltransferase 2